jgi:hypothetical protein
MSKHQGWTALARGVVAIAMVAGATVGLGGAGAAPVAATTWRPSPGVLPSSDSYAYLVSSSGDYIGGGRTWAYTAEDADLTVEVQGGTIGVEIRGDQRWSGTFDPPEGVSSVVAGATYTGLTRWPFNDPPGGGISWTGEGRGCNENFGSYAIDEVTYEAGVVTALQLRFEQRCERTGAPPLRGQIRWNSRAGLVPPTPTKLVPPFWTPPAGAIAAGTDSLYLSSQAGDYIGAGRTYSYGSDELGDVDGSGTQLRLGVGGWLIWLDASNRAERLTAGYYSKLQRNPFHNPVRGGFTIFGNGRGCNESESDLVIDAIDHDGAAITDLELRFAHRCDGDTAAFRGQLRWQQAPPAGAPGAPTGVIATPGVRSATVTWKAPTSPGSSPITGYEVIPYTQGDQDLAPVQVDASARSATITGLPEGVAHTFKVRAKSAVGAGRRSDPIAAIAPWSPTPTLATATPASGPRTGGTTLSLAGTALAGTTGVKIGGVAASFSNVSGTRLDVVAPALPTGNHAIVVTTGLGTSSGGPTFDALALAPGAPAGLVATPRHGGFDVTWSAASSGDAPITTYAVTATADGASTPAVTDIVSSIDPRSSRLSGLRPGTSYRVAVRATSAVGTGPATTSTLLQVPPPELGPFGSVASLVDRQYRDFVGRPPTASEAALGVAAIADGTATSPAWIATMRQRAEWARHRAPVVRLYAAYFGRLPDAGGLEYWVGKLRIGTSLDRVSATFAGSSEFKRKYGSLSNRQFVQLVYQNVLKRSPDAGGLSFWTGKLDRGMSRGTVMTNFSESSENVRKTAPLVDVVLLTTGMLRRMPTSGELTAALADLDGGGTLEDLARDLLTGSTYAARF